MEKKSTGDLRERMLHALALNRKAKLNFPGVFMGTAGHRQDGGEVALEFDDAGETFRDAHGEIDFSALGVLLDVALGCVTRIKAGPHVRPATVHLTIQMTGATTRDRHVVAHSRFTGWSSGTPLRQGLSAATLAAGQTPIAHASGAFLMLDLPPGREQFPLPWVREGTSADEIGEADLEDFEREALKRFDRARAAASAQHPFVEQFWGGAAKAGGGKARSTVKVAPHLSNRVGQVHGGLLVGIAARTASAALPRSMRLSNISSWFISPGQGPNLRVRSQVVQHGRSLAVVRTQIVGASGKLVLETTSQHVTVHTHV